jgi:hypothetical protein
MNAKYQSPVPVSKEKKYSCHPSKNCSLKYLKSLNLGRFLFACVFFVVVVFWVFFLFFFCLFLFLFFFFFFLFYALVKGIGSIIFLKNGLKKVCRKNYKNHLRSNKMRYVQLLHLICFPNILDVMVLENIKLSSDRDKGT